MKNLISFLAHKAYNMRVSSILETTHAHSGHVTSALSCADIVATLFFHTMRYDPQHPHNPNNDRFILSKGHASPILYAAWKEAGILTADDLLMYRSFHSVLEGHPTARFDRFEAATGSLGQGLSIGLGMSLSARLDHRDFRTYVLLGDSECAEGSVWEAAEVASFYKVDNLIAIIDVNRLGQSDQTMEGWDLTPYVDRFTAFGWHTITINGHDMQEIVNAFDQAQTIKNQPTVIIAKTIKGYGVEMVANKNGYHGKPFSQEQMPEALKELHDKFKDVADAPSNYSWQPKLPKQEQVKKFSEITLPDPNYNKGQEMPTRKAYGQALAALGDVSQDVVSLDAEVKNSTFAEIFEQKHPQRFFQCFVAEQNMVGMGVGFAARNKIPFVSTFAVFFTRAFDQIRMSAIGDSTIHLVGSHAGASIGEDGPSQMGLEDIAMIRTVPHSIILYPSDAVSTWKLVEQMANYRKGISYLRTTRGQTPVLYGNDEQFEIGGCKVIRQHGESHDVCIVAAGITLFEALKAHGQLHKEGINASVVDLYSIKPLDVATLKDMARKSNNRLVTVEDHYLEGGIGESIVYALRNTNTYIECLAVHKLPRSGKPDELLVYEEIDAAAIVKKVKEMIQH